MRRQIRTKAYCSVKLFVKLPRSFTGVRCNFEEAIQVPSEFFKRSDTFFYSYLHGSLGYGHVEILQDVVWIFTVSVTFEGVSYAHCLLSVPRRIVQAWRGQCRIRWYRHVHAGVCIVLHIVRVY